MKLPILLLALAGMLAPAGPARAQDAAGRVILAAGTVVIVRGAGKLPATPGTPLRPGDTVEVGAQSHAQLYLTDDSIISLRPETTFRIREYSFQPSDPSTGRAFFDLVRGGMRTVTGLLNRRESYGVSTTYSTIGIRGTHYWLVTCSQDCRNSDGTLAADGDYGLVREGRVGVAARTTRQAGPVFGSDQIMHVQNLEAGLAPLREFGSDQVFHVARATGATQELIGPPPFLFAQLGGAQPPKPVAPGAVPGKPAVEPKPVPEKPAPVVPPVTPVLAQTGDHGATGDLRFTSNVTNNTNFTFANVVQQSATVGPLTDPVLQTTSAISVIGPAAVLESTGSVYYRLTGPFSLPVSCTDPPCAALTTGDITLAVDLAQQLAYIRVNAADDEGGIVNISTPPAARGMPITVSGGVITFNSTFNRNDPAFARNQGAFRCLDCGPSSGVNYFDSMTFSGTISGSSATVTVSATDSTGDSGTATATLTQQLPPNNLAGAMNIPRSGGGSDSISAAYWDVDADASGRALRIAQGGTVGARIAKAGSAVNTLIGSAAAAGNLAWGTWSGGGAHITDINYNTFTTISTQTQQWITGSPTNAVPVGLGSSVTYSPVGYVINNNNGILNSASLTANFIARTVDVSINATNVGAGNTFQMNGSSGFISTNGRFQAGFASVSCSGPCAPGTPGGGFAGFFAGPNAEGAGVAFNAGYGGGGGVNGAIGMKR